MTTQEQELLKQIKDQETEQKEARQLVAHHKKGVVEAESRLISANIQIERLREELRVLRVQNPIQEETSNERDIREFKERLPEIMKKIQ